jgi:integrase
MKGGSELQDLISEFGDWMGAANASLSTIRLREVVLRLADRELPNGLLAIESELAAWLRGTHKRPWSPKTRATYYECLFAFYDWCVDNRKLDRNPMLKLKRPRVPRGVPRPVTDAQLAALLDSEQPWRLAVVLAAYAGLRCCEIATLTAADVTEDQIRVTGKGGVTALVDMHPRVWSELQAILRVAGSPITKRAEPFIVLAGGMSDAGWITRRAGPYFRRRLGLKVTLHQCRHWYGTNVLAATGNVEAARQALRHSSIATTQRYIELQDGQRRRGILALPVRDAVTG